MTTAKIDKTTHGHLDVPAGDTVKPKVRPDIAYLEFLKKHNLLELAIQDMLPKHVERAAKTYVISELRAKYGKEAVPVNGSDGNFMISVTQKEKDAQSEEVNEYLRHYNLQKMIAPYIFKAMPREIYKGTKYMVKSGHFKDHVVLVKGLDTEHFGCRWDENYGNQLCEKYMFRIQQDQLGIKGLVYVAHLMAEKRDILLNEKEIGDLIV